MSYKIEFPDFVMDVSIPADWRDDSWHNDSHPSFIVPAANLKVWVDYADRSLSEWSEYPRFMVCTYNNDDDAALLTTDNWSDVLAFVAQYTADVQSKLAAGSHVWACNGCGQRYHGAACVRCGDIYRFLAKVG